MTLQSKSRSANHGSSNKHQIDYKRIASEALMQSQRIVELLIPGGTVKGCEYAATNPRRADKSAGSFMVNLDTGVWSDFATTDNGGDLISLWAYVKDVKQSAAATGISKLLSIPEKHGNEPLPVTLGTSDALDVPKKVASVTGYPKTSAGKEWTPLLVVPDNAPASPNKHPQHGAPSAKYIYSDTSGKVAFYIYRFDLAGGKQFSPLTYCVNSKGEHSWRWQGYTEPRPLYRLDALINKPDAPVVIAEGEKAAEAAQILFTSSIVTTWSNGAQSVKKTNWGDLKGRDIVLWADNDEPGIKAMEQIAEILREIGVKSLAKIDNQAIADSKSVDLPDGFDAADAIEIGLTVSDLQTMDANGKLFAAVHADRTPNTSDKFGPFLVKDTGVWYHDPAGEKELMWICSRLDIKAAVRTNESEGWSRVLEFKDAAGHNHVWAMPMEMLSGSGEGYRGILLSKGLQIAPSSQARNLLSMYLQSANPGVLGQAFDRTGWQETKNGQEKAVFVTPKNVIGSSADEVMIYKTSSPVEGHLRQKGTIEQWQTSVARLCAGNSRLVLAVCLSFAAPLLYIAEEESGGIHLRGSSSCGKTTALIAGSSVYGGADYMRNWRVTSNGIESAAVSLCDLPMFLDEMAQVKPEEAGDIAYMLANGRGKGRSDKNSEAKVIQKWRLFFMSAGEISLSSHMKEGGKYSTAGQEIRTIDVPADAGVGLGIFESLQGQKDGDALARSIKAACAQSHGTVGLKWIELLAEKMGDARAIIQELRRQFIESLSLDATHAGQVQRAASRFSLIAAAGELATQRGLTGWQEGEAFKAARKCFADWLESRGSSGSLEASKILDHVRLFIEQYGESRFTLLGQTTLEPVSDRVTNLRAGFRSIVNGKTMFYVLPAVFTEAIVKGFDRKLVVKTLIDAGWLQPGTNGTATVKKIEGHSTKVYALTANMLGDPDAVPDREIAY